MRTDTVNFAAKNTAPAKRPRYVIELSFDSANATLWYFTSHADAALPPGASSILSVIEGLSGTSQTLNPDTANATIGNINFTVVDRASVVTTTLGSQLVLGRSTRRQRVRVYVGFEDLVWADYTLVQTQLVTEIAYAEGAYKFTCADIQREMRKDIFEIAKTTLAQSLSASATTIDVFSTSAFETVAHGTSYSDAPSSTVGYLRIQDEVIRYTGKTSTQFTGCTRGALNTRAVEHAVDASTTADRRTAVEEYVYLELPAVDLMYRLLTGKDRLGNAVMPTAWHLGISTAYIRLTDFTGIGEDLWDTADDEAGFVVRFEGLTKTDGKKFIESELALLTGVFMPVYADGALGLKRMSNMLAGAAYVKMLDGSNLVSVGDLVHDFNSLRNVIQVEWNWEPRGGSDGKGAFTRVNFLIDSDSISTHGRSDPLKLKFRGLHGSRHSSTILAQRFDALRDRYSGPPLRQEVKGLPSLNTLEVGDVVRNRSPGLRDFVSNGDLDRSCEIQNISINWLTGDVGFKLFASSQAPGAIPPTADTTVLSDAWYSSAGTDLSGVVTITGSNPGHITAGGTLTGTADMNAAGSVFYYLGDLVIDPGVTVNLVNNAYMRVKGFLQINGTLNGRGNGLAGGAKLPDISGAFSTVVGHEQDYSPGTAGFIGSTEAGGGHALRHNGNSLIPSWMESVRGAVVAGANSAMPSFNLAWDGTTLAGVPGDLRGTSGSSGMPYWDIAGGVLYTGAAGGAGGAGLLIVSRGIALGVAGLIDVSGGDGSAAPLTGDYPGGDGGVGLPGYFYAGSGAGGAPGGLAVFLDGSGATATGLTASQFIAENGATPIMPTPWDAPSSTTVGIQIATHSSYFVGTGDGTTFDLPSLSGARGGSRVQYVPGNAAAVADLSPTLAAPTNFGLSSGTDELLTASDGTITVRIKVMWTPATDSRVLGYDIQSKFSADSIWSSIPPVLGQASNTAWITGVRDGVSMDVRIRSAGAAREVSDWVTITGYTVIGKTALPSNVGALNFTDPFLSWASITDPDRRGYIVRYQSGANTDWASATPAHKAGFITETRFDTGDIVGGSTTLLVKSVDTSGNESETPASLLVDLRPATPTTFMVSRQPDGTREFTWSTDTPPDDLSGTRIRYFLGTTSDWEAMTALQDGLLVASPLETNQLAAGTYTFAAKNVDRPGNESAAAIFITAVTIGDPRIAGAVEDVKEEPTWAGTKTDCIVDPATGWLIATDTASTWATLPSTWDAWTSWTNTPTSPITYERKIDIGVKTKFTPLVTVFADGAQTIEEKHSDDDISYSSYAALGPLVDARYIWIKVTLTGAFPKLKTERIILNASPLVEYIEDQNSASLAGDYRIGTGDVRAPITKIYSIIKKVDVTLQSVGPGWSWELIDKDKTVGPRIKLYNSSNTLADAVFDVTVTGIA